MPQKTRNRTTRHRRLGQGSRRHPRARLHSRECPGLHPPPRRPPRDARQILLFFKRQLHPQSHFQKRSLRVHDHLLGNRPAQPHPQSSRSELLDVRAHRPPSSPEFPRRRSRQRSHGTCKIIPTDIYDLDATHPAYVNPLEPVHQVLNLAEFNQRAVSIHVYSKPFDSCEVYTPRTGHLRRCPAPLHQRIRQAQSLRKTFVAPAFQPAFFRRFRQG